MIENYRNASIWLRFMQNPYVQTGMGASGAQFVATVDADAADCDRDARRCGATEPVRGRDRRAPYAPGSRHGAAHGARRDGTRGAARLLDGWQPAGSRTVRFRGDGLANGVYWYRLPPGMERWRTRVC